MVTKEVTKGLRRGYPGPAYEQLKFYQNTCQIRKLVMELTERFGRNHVRLVNQMRDAARSAKQNIREGYSRDSAEEFARSIRVSRGSLNELEGDLDDCLQDQLINADEHQQFKRLFRQTKYLMDRYLDSLHDLNQRGLWKRRFSR